MTTTDDRYWQLAETLLDTLHGLGPAGACPHARSADVLHACGAHPAAGLSCPACSESHRLRHSVDRGCVVCGARGASADLHRTWPVLALDVAMLDGKVLRWTGGVEALLGYACRGHAPAG